MSLRLGPNLLALVLATLVAAAPAAAHPDKSPRVVASGLDNPRGLAVDHRGTVYVTEAGTGGTGPCIAGPEGDEICAGATGAVTKAWHGGQRRIVEGLPSLAAPGGASAIGPSDIHLRHWGGAYLTVGLGADPAVRDALGELGPSFGLLHKLSRHDGLRTVADIAAFEATANPDGGLPDSNPHSVTTRRGRTYVVDAGGNSLLRVHRSGEISTVAVFPDRLVDAPPGIPDLPPQLPMQAVPTSVVVGPDGALYVSQLTGFPFPPGAANIYRVEPGSEPEVYASGFTNVTDLAFDRRGNLYVLEFAANGILSGDPTGALTRVGRDGSHEPVAIEGLVNPTGLAIGRKGELYISNHGAEPDAGEVLRIRP